VASKVKLTWHDRDLGYKKLVKELAKLGDGGAFVKVGVMSDKQNRHAGDPADSVAIGIIHEFGAKVSVTPGHGTVSNAFVRSIGQANFKAMGGSTVEIPERSWLRGGVDKYRAEWERLREELVGKIYEGKLTIERALGLLGARAAADLKKNITDGPGIPPPNAPSTAIRKQARGSGFVRTLVDTGRFVASITWSVVLGGGHVGFAASKVTPGGDAHEE
jgi:hypothetical protein